MLREKDTLPMIIYVLAAISYFTGVVRAVEGEVSVNMFLWGAAFTAIANSMVNKNNVDNLKEELEILKNNRG